MFSFRKVWNTILGRFEEDKTEKPPVKEPEKPPVPPTPSYLLSGSIGSEAIGSVSLSSGCCYVPRVIANCCGSVWIGKNTYYQS